jgi:hypothetical protein
MVRLGLQAAVEAFDLEGYVALYGARWETAVERAVVCPHCGKQKLVINLEKRLWHCWSCETVRSDARGNLVDLIRVLEGVDRTQAVSRILANAQLGLESVGSLREIGGSGGVGFEEAPEIPMPAHCRRVDDTGILPYCRKRGITLEDARRFGLWWGMKGRYANRLFFPVYENGRLVYWQARAMWTEAEQKVGRYIKSLNPPKKEGEAGAGDVLFNLDQARRARSVVINEGPIDALKVGWDAVCSFGKRLTPKQVSKLIRAGVEEIELMWDGPSEREPLGAWTEMWKTAARYQRFFRRVSLVFVPRGDPGDYSRAQNRWFRRYASKTLGGTPSRLQEI